jgi:lipopolysaccharide biosynthesis glycosyltransferase
MVIDTDILCSTRLRELKANDRDGNLLTVSKDQVNELALSEVPLR